MHAISPLVSHIGSRLQHPAESCVRGSEPGLSGFWTLVEPLFWCRHVICAADWSADRPLLLRMASLATPRSQEACMQRLVAVSSGFTKPQKKCILIVFTIYFKCIFVCILPLLRCIGEVGVYCMYFMYIPTSVFRCRCIPGCGRGPETAVEVNTQYFACILRVFGSNTQNTEYRCVLCSEYT